MALSHLVLKVTEKVYESLKLDIFHELQSMQCRHRGRKYDDFWWMQEWQFLFIGENVFSKAFML